MFLSSPRVDSIFSRENWFSPSADLSLATQELSSVTVLSSSTHSFTSTSSFFTQVSEVAFTLAYLSLSPATSSSRALTSVRSVGLERPSAAFFSAPSSQGLNSLMPVLYSAQYLTSLEYLSHSILVSA